MNKELEGKIRKILMKEYRKHSEQVCERHKYGHFLNSWSHRMQKIGIKIFQGKEHKDEYVTVCTGLFMGHVQIPTEIAKKILILGGIP